MSIPEATDEHHQTVKIIGDPVATFAECIGVAVAAMAPVGALGICLDDPSLRIELTEALRREGIVNFRIVDRKHALAAYHKRLNKPGGFRNATTVLALGAAEYAYRKPVRGFSVVGRPSRVPGGPVGAAAAAIVCAGAVTMGYAQNGFNGASDSSLGGPTYAFPTPPKGAKPRPIHLNVRPVYNVSPESVEDTTQPYYYYRAPRDPDAPLEVMMPDGKVIKVELPPMLEPPRDLRTWLRQFLMPTKPEQQQTLPVPSAPQQQPQKVPPPPPLPGA